MAMSEEAERLLKNLLVEDSEIDFRIRVGTELYRKGFGRIFLKGADGRPLSGATVRLRQLASEYKFGCNAFMVDQFPSEEQNRRYEEVFASIFNLAVVPFYWSDLEPEADRPRFGCGSEPVYRRPPPDRVLEFCDRYGITPKGHPLCWHQFRPSWLPGDRKSVRRLLEKRFREISDRYGDRIGIWDAVNEAQTRYPLEYSRDFPLGDDHVEFAFRLADRCFSPSAQLIYNDDCRWWDCQGDYSPVYLLVRRLLDRNLPVGGLGLQFHMFEPMLRDSERALNARIIFGCLDQYAKLNLPINFSEVSILSRRDLGDGDRFQELAVERLYRLWFSHPATEAIVWWNLVDGTAAYAPLGSEEGENRLRAGLVGYDFAPKPAFRTLERLIRTEWRTETGFDYADGGDNRFHGFYGDYAIEVRYDGGSFTRRITLSKDGVREFTLSPD